MATSPQSRGNDDSTITKDGEPQFSLVNQSDPMPMPFGQSAPSIQGSAKDVAKMDTSDVGTVQRHNEDLPPEADQKKKPDNANPVTETKPFNEEWMLMKAQLELLQSKIKSMESSVRTGEDESKTNGSQDVSEEESSARFVDEPASEIKEEVNETPRFNEPPRLATSLLEDKTDSVKPQIRPIPEVHLVDWTGFKNVCLEERKIYAIEVLMGPAKFYWQRHSEEKARKRHPGTLSAGRAQVDGGFELTTEQLRKAQKEVPERIRINSKHILSVLSDIMSEELELRPTVFLRPYKPLVLYDSEIRQWLKYLESKWGSNAEGDKKEALEHGIGQASAEVTKDSVTIENIMDTGIQDDTTPSGATTSILKDISRPPNPEEKEKDERDKKAEENLSDSLQSLDHLRCLVKFMDEYVSPVVEQCRSPATRKIHFRDLSYLFQPGGEVVYSQDLDSADQRQSTAFASSATVTPQRNMKRGKQTMWKILQVSQGRPVLGTSSVVRGGAERLRPPVQKITPLKLLCYMIGFDGTKFGPIHHVFDIAPFEGEKDIVSLEIVPAKVLENEAELRERLRSQGLKFMTFTTPSHQQYTGPTLMHHPGGILCKLARRSENVDGNVIVDFKEATRSNKEWVLSLAIPEELGGVGLETTEDFPVSYWKDIEQKNLDFTKDDLIYEDGLSDGPNLEEYISRDKFLSAFKNRLSDDQVDGSDFTDSELVLLPDRVCAFNLHRRCFTIIGLQGLRSVAARTEGWSDLKLPRGHKKMVQAQVEIHFREKKLRDAHLDRHYDYDLVRGKGQGLIILLHGAPGVGKTSTAECVAESLQKPLYPITCGDLGVSAKEVEETLAETFAKAEAWDCVLLLDEADVFLAQRTRTDLKRNAIVSVFLRVLEYYKGILFLTTNRVGAFDEAFKSRIHMHLYYPILNKDQTKSIWRMNLDRTIKRKGHMMTFNESGIMEYAELHFEYHKQRNTRWNGRQIHNAFRTAAALAEYEAQEAYEKTTRQPDFRTNDHPIRAKLDVDHFKIVSDASHLFDSYITETIGGTDAERALNDRDRADNFKWATVRDQDFYPSRQPYQPPQYPFSPPQQPQFARTEFDTYRQQQYLRRLDPQNTPPPSEQSRPPQSWPRPGGEDLSDMYAQGHDAHPPWASPFSQRRVDASSALSMSQMGLGAAAGSSTEARGKAVLDPDDGY